MSRHLGMEQQLTRRFVEALERRVMLDAGDLDLSFGVGGKVRVSMSTSDDTATRVAVQSDGRILVGGPTSSSTVPNAVGIVRLLENGNMDESFGSSGKVYLPLGTVHGLVVQPNGAILVAGKSPPEGPTNNDFRIMRLLQNGSPDPSFGIAGVVESDFHARSDEPSDMSLLSDGRILVTGNAITLAGHSNFVAAKYLSDGSPDAEFGGGDGKVSIDFAGGPDVLFAHAIQEDGKVVLGGYSFSGPLRLGFSFARLQENGSLDGAFGTGGKVAHNLGEEMWDVALQADGRIVGAGKGGNAQFMIARFNSDGSRDESFGTSSGSTLISFVGNDVVTSANVTTDNRILLSGWGSSRDFQLARLNPGGSIDHSFGNNGKVSTDFEFSNDDCIASTIDDGRIVAVGSTSGVIGTDFGVVRYDAGTLTPIIPPVAAAQFNFATSHNVTIGFTSNVGPTLSLSDISLVNLTTGTTPAPGTMSLAYHSGSNTATLTFPGLPSQRLAEGRYRLTLSAQGISDVNGFRLDGDGDGVPGGDYLHEFFFLIGDADHDGIVNLNDFNILAANFGQSPRDFTQGDFNYDTLVNLADFDLLAARFGMVLEDAFEAERANSRIMDFVSI